MISTDRLSNGLLAHLLLQAVNQTRDGISITDMMHPDAPLIYVNRGFEKMTGYLAADVVGKTHRILQGIDAEQPELPLIRDAVEQKNNCEVVLRSYRKNGSMYWCELSLSPVLDNAGQLTHYICIHRDVSDRVLSTQSVELTNESLHQTNQQLANLAYTDEQLGLSNRRHFEERFAQLRSMAQRSHSELSVLMIDVDYFHQFNHRYGRATGDECLRMVGECIAKSFARSSDCAARYGGELFAVITLVANREELERHAQRLCEQIRSLNIPNTDSPHGVVTISIGGIHRKIEWQTPSEEFVALADRELHDAKEHGKNCVKLAG